MLFDSLPESHPPLLWLVSSPLMLGFIFPSADMHISKRIQQGDKADDQQRLRE